MTLNELYEKLDGLYPESLSAPWDNDGKMVFFDGERQIRRVLCCLDCDGAALAEAIRKGCDLILAHHPLFFKPIKALDIENPLVARALALYRNGIALISLHTRLDAGEGGVNDTLADALGLTERSPLILDGQPLGRIGRTERTMTGREFACFVKERLSCPSLRIVHPDKQVNTVALIGGSGGSYFREISASGCDAFLTGEATHHQMLDAQDLGLCLISAGHDYTERLIAGRLAELVRGFDESIETFVCTNIAIGSL